MSTSSVRPSWTQRLMKAARAWTPLILGPPPSSRDPNDLHAHTACCLPSPPSPPSPPPHHHLPHSPIIKSPLAPPYPYWKVLRGRETSECHFAQPSSSRLHCYNAAKGERLIVITHGPSVISATLETGISVAAAFRAPVFPLLKQKVSYYIHWLIHFCEGTFLATKTQVFSFKIIKVESLLLQR